MHGTWGRGSCQDVLALREQELKVEQDFAYALAGDVITDGAASRVLRDPILCGS